MCSLFLDITLLLASFSHSAFVFFIYRIGADFTSQGRGCQA